MTRRHKLALCGSGCVLLACIWIIHIALKNSSEHHFLETVRSSGPPDYFHPSDASEYGASVIEPLWKIYQTSSGEKQGYIIAAIAKADDRESIPYLVQGLESTSRHVQRASARALSIAASRAGNDRAFYLATTHSVQPDVVLEFAKMLQATRDPRAVRLYGILLDSSSEDLRQEAVNGLLTIDSPEARSVLMSHMRDASPPRNLDSKSRIED